MQAVASNAALYIMSHDVDMQNPVCWLEKGVSGYSLPDMSQQVNPIRLCVQPCQLQFRSQAAHAKSEQDTSHNAKNSPVQYLHMKVCWCLAAMVIMIFVSTRAGCSTCHNHLTVLEFLRCSIV